MWRERQRVGGGIGTVLVESPEMPSPKPTVRSIMSTPVQTVVRTAGALAASEQMTAKGVRHLVVIEANGRVVGVLSDRDLRSAQPSVFLVPDAAMRKKALGMVRLEDVMTAHPTTVRDDQPVEDALQTMLKQRLGCLPVLDRRGDLVGIVTPGDVTKLALALVRQQAG